MKWMQTNHQLLMGVILSLMLSGPSNAECTHPQAEQFKQAIINQSSLWKGQGDPDGSKQAALDKLVNQLLAICPQKSIQDRLPLLYGAWQQVWGPYTYRDDSRGVDPTLDPEHIYQVVFPGGYYYNVSPDRDKQGKPKGKTTLLRGEYKLDPIQPDVLSVHFTHLKGVQGTPPEGLTYIQLPALSEKGQLKQFTRLPALLVRWFFGDGALKEVYTDETLRITYGSNNNTFNKSYIYILTRVAE